MNKLGLGVFLLLIPLLLPAGCSPNVNFNGSTSAPVVRVRILENQEKVVVAARGATVFKSSNDRTQRQFDLASGSATVALGADGWHVGNVVFPAGELTLHSPGAGAMSVNGAAYRGQYRLVPTSMNRFDVVNDVDIDSYVCGVLREELYAGWNIETYKAQAIVARTYALYTARTSPAGKTFDLYPDVRSQVYGGVGSETNKSRQASLETSGVVVAFGPKGEEKIFKAYFMSCCGGVGQSAYDAFGDADIPPLRAKVVGDLCSASTKFNWGPIVLSKDEATRRIRAWAANPMRNRAEKDMAKLSRIDVAPGALHGGRPVRFLLTDARGQQYSMNGEELRWACNTDPKDGQKLLSSYVTPVSVGDTIQFTNGHGWGHGVGMCQWCAEALAQRGQAHEDIVRYSYPGAVLVRAY